MRKCRQRKINSSNLKDIRQGAIFKVFNNQYITNTTEWEIIIGIIRLWKCVLVLMTLGTKILSIGEKRHKHKIKEVKQDFVVLNSNMECQSEA